MTTIHSVGAQGGIYREESSAIERKRSNRVVGTMHGESPEDSHGVKAKLARPFYDVIRSTGI